MKQKLYQIFNLLKKSVKKFRKDDPVRLAGTIAYFTVFAIAPIIILMVSVSGILLGKEAFQAKLYEELIRFIGEQGTQYIRDLVANYQDTQKSVIGTIVGFGIFIFTSTTFFSVLQKSLNYVWRVSAKPTHGILKTLKDRALSFGMILSLGFLLLVFFLIDAALAVLNDYLNNIFADRTLNVIKWGNTIISMAVITLVFAMIYKFLPDAKIKWKATWVGAIITMLLFMGGRYLIGLVLGTSNIGIMYGAAGSLVVILIWVFYSSLIFFFGAEITQQYAATYSHQIVPKENAVKIEINEVSSE